MTIDECIEKNEAIGINSELNVFRKLNKMYNKNM